MMKYLAILMTLVRAQSDAMMLEDEGKMVNISSFCQMVPDRVGFLSCDGYPNPHLPLHASFTNATDIAIIRANSSKVTIDSGYTKLRKLVISHSPIVSSFNFSHYVDFEHLYHIHLYHTNITDIDTTAAANMTSLQIFHITSGELSELNQDTDFKHFPNLTDIALKDLKMMSALDFQYLPPTLTKLELDGLGPIALRLGTKHSFADLRVHLNERTAVCDCLFFKDYLFAALSGNLVVAVNDATDFSASYCHPESGLTHYDWTNQVFALLRNRHLKSSCKN